MGDSPETGVELSMRRKHTATFNADGRPVGEHESFPTMAVDKAVKLLDDRTYWVRSAHLEYFYRYAIIEEAATGKRFVVEGFGLESEPWATVLRWLCAPDRSITMTFGAPSASAGIPGQAGHNLAYFDGLVHPDSRES